MKSTISFSWRITLATGLALAGARGESASIPLTPAAGWPGHARGPTLGVDVASHRAYFAAGRAGLLVFQVDDLEPECKGQYVTPTDFARVVRVAGNRVYVAHDRQLVPPPMTRPSVDILADTSEDSSDPFEPVLLGTFTPSGAVNDLYVSNGRACVAGGAAGLEIFDVANLPPTRLGHFDTPGNAKALCVAGPLAYVADGSGGLLVADIQDPSQPVLLGTYATSGEVSDVTVIGQRAYLAIASRWTGSNHVGALEILDVTNPANSVRLGEHPTANVLQVQVCGSLAYLLCRSDSGPALNLEIVDVSSGSAPVRVSETTVGWPYSAAPSDLQVVGDRAYVASAGVAAIMDVSDPAQPVRLPAGEISGDARDVQVAGNFAYLADGSAGLEIIDFRSPDRPIQIATHLTSGEARLVRVVGGHAYVISDGTNSHSTLEIVRVQDPANPVRVAAYVTGGHVSQIYVTGELALLAMADPFGTSTGPDLLMLQVSNPTNPVLAATYTVTNGPAWVRDVKMIGSLMYLVVRQVVPEEEDYDLLQILDWSGPNAPVLLSSMLIGSAWAFDVAGHYAYYVGDETGLRVVDVSNPRNPTILGWRFGESYGDVQAQGNRVWVAGSELTVFDVSDPNNPTVAGSIPINAEDDGEDVRLHVLGNRVFVANVWVGLQVFEGAGEDPAGLMPPWYRVSSGTTFHLNDVTFGAGRYVAVSALGTVVTSTNGLDWSSPSPPAYAALTGVTHGNGLFVAVGPQTGSRVSTNGLDWVAGGPALGMLGVTYGAGQFVSVGLGPGVHVSTNGVSWRSVWGDEGTLRSVAFGDGRFVLVGDRGAIFSSTKAVSWQEPDVGLYPDLADVTFGDGLFVAVGAGGTILCSTDGLAWFAPEPPSTNDWFGVAFGDGRFVAIGRASNGEAIVGLSRNGYFWSSVVLPGVPPWNDLTFGNGSFVAVGEGGAVVQTTPVIVIEPPGGSACVGAPVRLSIEPLGVAALAFQWQHESTNIPGATARELRLDWALPADAGEYRVEVLAAGTNRVGAAARLQVELCPVLDHWRPRVGGTANALNGLACGQGRLVAVGAQGAIFYTDDGMTGLPSVSGTNTALNAIAHGDGQFVAVGNGGLVLTSPDAASWTRQDSGTNQMLRGVARGAGRFVAVGNGGVVAVSSNSVAWMAQSITNRALIGIAFAGDLFVAVGASGIIFTSPDGLTWTPRLSPITGGITLYSAAWGAGAWVIVGNAGTILRSSNAVDWTEVPSPTAALLDGLVFTGGEFVAVGAGGVILNSRDGLSWTQHSSATSAALHEVIGCGHTLWAVGDRGLILQTGYHGPPLLTGAKSETGYQLTVTGEIATAYRLQAANHLPSDTWLDLLSFTNLTPVTSFLIPVANEVPQRFYRVVSP